MSLLVGCGSGLPSAPILLPALSGNWQIQAAVGAPNLGIFLAGNVVVTGTNGDGSPATATMLLSDLNVPNSCGNIVTPLTFTGTASYDQGLVLTSAPVDGSVVSLSLDIPSSQYAVVTGTLAITGPSCNYPSSSAIGAEIAPVSGSFSGTLSSTTALQPPTATLTLTQGSAAGANGQFPLNGVLKLSGSYCSLTYNMTGTVGGTTLSLASTPDPTTGVSVATLTAYTNILGTELSNVMLVFASGPCSASLSSYDTYTGTLTLP